ncbi:hypothetical protein Bca4012_025810 [Brassica carinata]
MEDEPSEDLNKMAVFSKIGYMFKVDDWRNRSVNLHDVNEEIARTSLLFENVEMGQSSSNEEFVLSKIDSVNQMMEDNFTSMNCRLSLIEKEKMDLKAHTDTELLDETATKLGEANPDQADRTFENEVRPEVILPIDPFVTPGFPRPFYINGREKEKDFFEYMDDAENNLKEEMLECKSLGLKNMSNINDDNAMDLRSKLCCEIFDKFMDKDFQEGCRK